VKRALTGADVVIQSLGIAARLEAILKPTRFFSKATPQWTKLKSST
jgi:hypothetical protein